MIQSDLIQLPAASPPPCPQCKIEMLETCSVPTHCTNSGPNTHAPKESKTRVECSRFFSRGGRRGYRKLSPLGALGTLFWHPWGHFGSFLEAGTPPGTILGTCGLLGPKMEPFYTLSGVHFGYILDTKTQQNHEKHEKGGVWKRS